MTSLIDKLINKIDNNSNINNKRFYRILKN